MPPTNWILYCFAPHFFPTCLPHPYPDAVKLGGRVPFNDSIHLLGFFEKRKFVLRTDYAAVSSSRVTKRSRWR